MSFLLNFFVRTNSNMIFSIVTIRSFVTSLHPENSKAIYDRCSPSGEGFFHAVNKMNVSPIGRKCCTHESRFLATEEIASLAEFNQESYIRKTTIIHLPNIINETNGLEAGRILKMDVPRATCLMILLPEN